MTILNAINEIASIKEAEATAIRNLGKALAEAGNSTDEAPKDTKAKKSAAKPLFDPTPKATEDVKVEAKEEVTIEQIRALLAEKSQAGLTSQVKELLTKYGATKLSAVKPEDYAAVFEAAKALG